MSVTAPPRRPDDSGDVVPLGGRLFRSEILAEQQSQWLGTVLLVPRISHVTLSMLAGLVAAGILAIMFFASYTRTARINGWLVPERGIVRIFAPQPGVLTQLQVEEGTEVRKGAPLLLLSTEVQSEAVGATREAVVQQLLSRRGSLATERDRQRQLETHQTATLSGRLAAIGAEQKSLERDFQLQRARIVLTQQDVERQRELFAKHLTPISRLQQAEEETLQQALAMQALERQQANLGLEFFSLQAELWEVPLRSQDRLAETDRHIAGLDQEIAEAEARREIVITAPEDGTVTSIQAERGGSVNTNVPLLSLVPKGSELKVQLFAPSRVVGFMRPGQRVLLRYEAFPYQKFGHYEGTVASVSRSAISPSGLSQQLSGLTSLYGSNVPVYQISVTLAGQTVTAYGKAVPLQSGMQLEADVLIERRRLFEWVLDPLFTVTGRWHG